MVGCYFFVAEMKKERLEATFNEAMVFTRKFSFFRQETVSSCVMKG